MKKSEIKTVLKQLDAMPLPPKEKILSACPEPSVSEKTLNLKERSGSPFRFQTYRWKPALVTCMAAVILLCSALGYTVFAEAKEYKDAVAFFKEYQLSTDGLSRAEIKEVFRDITTGTFSYDKTAGVIEKIVGGYEISQNEPTPEDLEYLWSKIRGGRNGLYSIQNSTNTGNDVSYRYDGTGDGEERGMGVFEKYVKEDKLWSVRLVNCLIENYVVFGDRILVYGGAWQDNMTRLALLSTDGEVLWDKTISNGFKMENMSAVFVSSDEIVVFSLGDFAYLCMAKYDMEGNQKNFVKNDVGDYGIWNVAKLGDGYIVQLGNYVSNAEHIVKVDGNGLVTDSFTYDSEEESYYITNMTEYSGKIYFSAYSVPKLKEGESDYGGRDEIALILDYIWNKEGYEVSNEELTKFVRDHYTAVLLVCDPESGEPQEFFSVKGSLGGKLSMSDTGNLLWDAESITDTFFSPATSSFSIGGASHVYRYTFDETGKLLSQEKTGEVVNFRR